MAYGSGPYGSVPYGGSAAPTRKQINDMIIKALEDKGGGSPACPICRTKQFAVGEFVPLPTAPNPLGNLNPYGQQQVLPCVSLTCQNCGNTMLVNLLVLGFPDSVLRGWGFPSA